MREMNKIILYLGLLSLGFVSCKSASVSRSNVGRHTERESVSVSERDKDVLNKYASKLEVQVNQLKTPELYIVIDRWIGVPYRNGGTSKKGVDCSGFVGIVYKTITNRTLPRTTQDLRVAISATNRLQEGDLVFFNYNGKTNSHVGIYLQNGKFVHASSVGGVIVSDLNSAHYKKVFSVGGPLKIGRLNQLIN
jgi:lipoprotein Spr